MISNSEFLEILPSLHEACIKAGELQKKYHTTDIDIATTLLPREVIKIFPRTIPVGEEFGTVIVRLDGDSEKEWEVTTLRKDGSYGDGRRPDNVSFGTNIMDDLARRDFTINAMAIQLNKKELTRLNNYLLRKGFEWDNISHVYHKWGLI